MKPVAMFCLALVGAVGAAAQSSFNQTAPVHVFPQPSTRAVTIYDSRTQQTKTVLVQPPADRPACPVSVEARHGSSWNAMEVDKSRPKGVAQFLHLKLASAGDSRIAKATVTIRGRVPKYGATYVQSTLDSDRRNAARTLSVEFPDGTGKEPSADVWVPGLSAAFSIELVDATWADGTVWSRAAGQTCRTPIDGFMLVGER